MRLDEARGCRRRRATASDALSLPACVERRCEPLRVASDSPALRVEDGLDEVGAEAEDDDLVGHRVGDLEVRPAAVDGAAGRRAGEGAESPQVDDRDGGPVVRLLGDRDGPAWAAAELR